MQYMEISTLDGLSSHMSSYMMAALRFRCELINLEASRVLIQEDNYSFHQDNQTSTISRCQTHTDLCTTVTFSRIAATSMTKSSTSHIISGDFEKGKGSR